jgi:predicted XRE-type DNA-binding protein
MILEYSDILNFTSCSKSESDLNKQCSDLMSEIHGLLDLTNTPIKSVVKVLGVTASQARKLTKGEIYNFSLFELQTFVNRLNYNK